MNRSQDLEEQLREAACFGNDVTVRQLVGQGVSVNAQHAINGWSALHWAAKRGHSTIASFLVEHGADTSATTEKGEIPGQLASSASTRALFGLGQSDANGQSTTVTDNLPIVPNYMSNPPFPYLDENLPRNYTSPVQNTVPQTTMGRRTDEDELVLKVRVANSAERDFIEIELNRKNLTFEILVSTMCSELDVNRALIQKVRKLPNTIVRKDKDVNRLLDFQELELVLTNRALSESSRNYNGGPSVIPKHIDVVY